MARKTRFELPIHGQTGRVFTGRRTGHWLTERAISPVSCFWAICNKKDGESQKMFRSVNIILDARLQYDKSQADISVSNASKASLDHLTCFQDDTGCNGDSSFAAIDFFLWCCSVAAETPEGRETAVKLIVPRADGYLSKSGLLEQHLIEWEGVEKFQSFCQRRQYLRSQSAEQVQWDGLYQMLRNAVVGILVNVP